MKVNLSFIAICGLLLVSAIQSIYIIRNSGGGDKSPVTYKIDVHEREIDPGGPVNISIHNPKANGVEIVERAVPEEYIEDSLIRKAYIELSQRFDSLAAIRTYHYSVDDSTIKGEIVAKTQGYLRFMELDYDLQPIKVFDTTKTAVVEPDYLAFYGTGSITNLLEPEVGVTLSSERTLYSVAYNPLKKTLRAGFGLRLFRIKRKNKKKNGIKEF